MAIVTLIGWITLNSCTSEKSVQSDYFDVNVSELAQVLPLTQGSMDDQIKIAYKKSLEHIEPSYLLKIEKELDNANHKRSLALWKYWKAFLGYHKTLYYEAAEKPEKAEEVLDTSIAYLEDITSKNTDDHALLGMLQGFKINYTEGSQIMVLSIKAKKNIQKSLDLDKSNLRGHFVAGNNDFYTPKQYGGGMVIEKHLLKALQLNDQKKSNPYAPSWGREDTYRLLIQWYLRENMCIKAKAYFDEAVAKFPNNPSLSSLQQEWPCSI